MQDKKPETREDEIAEFVRKASVSLKFKSGDWRLGYSAGVRDGVKWADLDHDEGVPANPPSSSSGEESKWQPIWTDDEIKAIKGINNLATQIISNPVDAQMALFGWLEAFRPIVYESVQQAGLTRIQSRAEGINAQRKSWALIGPMQNLGPSDDPAEWATSKDDYKAAWVECDKERLEMFEEITRLQSQQAEGMISRPDHYKLVRASKHAGYKDGMIDGIKLTPSKEMLTEIWFVLYDAQPAIYENLRDKIWEIFYKYATPASAPTPDKNREI
jgi:hypothetical protein